MWATMTSNIESGTWPEGPGTQWILISRPLLITVSLAAASEA
jgi:hypothetical protein